MLDVDSLQYWDHFRTVSEHMLHHQHQVMDQASGYHGDNTRVWSILVIDVQLQHLYCLCHVPYILIGHSDQESLRSKIKSCQPDPAPSSLSLSLSSYALYLVFYPHFTHNNGTFSVYRSTSRDISARITLRFSTCSPACRHSASNSSVRKQNDPHNNVTQGHEKRQKARKAALNSTCVCINVCVWDTVWPERTTSVRYRRSRKTSP